MQSPRIHFLNTFVPQHMASRNPSSSSFRFSFRRQLTFHHNHHPLNTNQLAFFNLLVEHQSHSPISSFQLTLDFILSIGRQISSFGASHHPTSFSTLYPLSNNTSKLLSRSTHSLQLPHLSLEVSKSFPIHHHESKALGAVKYQPSQSYH